MSFTCSKCRKKCQSSRGLTTHLRYSTRCQLNVSSRSNPQGGAAAPDTGSRDTVEPEDRAGTPDLSLEAVERPENAGTGYTLGELMEMLDYESDSDMPSWISRRRGQLRQLASHRPAASFRPFADQFSLQLATFAFSTAKLSRPQIQELLDLLTLIPNFDPPFSNPDELLGAIDKIPFREMQLKEATITPLSAFDPFDLDPDDDDGEPRQAAPPAFLRPVSLRYYDIFDSVQHLLARPDLKDSIDYTPVQITNRRGDRVISNFMTANFAHQAQQVVPTHSTVVPLICASDETQLATMCGQQTAYPGYLSIGNYTNDVRKDARHKTMVQLFQLPVLHLSEEERKHKYWPSYLRQLIHECLKIVFKPLENQPEIGQPFFCPDAKYRLCRLFLASWIADYKEAVRIAMIVSGRCPICICTRAEMGLLRSFEARTKADSIQLREGGLTMLEQRLYGLKPGKNFTDNIPYADAHSMLSYDLLHGIIKPFGDHIVEWVRSQLSDSQARELTRRLKLVPHFADLHHFVNGIDFHFQGDDNRNLMKIWVSLLVDLGVNRKIVVACRFYISYTYSLRRSKHTIPASRSSTLQAPELVEHPEGATPKTTIEIAEQQLARFRSVRDAAFAPAREGLARPDEGTGFELPRHHTIVHGLSSIVHHGGLDGVSSDIPERLHIEEVKIPYRRSNKVEPEKQMLKYVGRSRKLQSLHRYLSLKGIKTLDEIAQERRGKGKKRSSRHRQLISSWEKGETELPIHHLSKSTTRGPLEKIARKHNLPFLLDNIVSYVIDNKAASFPRNLTTAELRAHVSDRVLRLRTTVHTLVNVYTELPDPTLDPTTSAKWIKSIVRSNKSWSYRDTSKRGGASFNRTAAKHPRHDHVFFQEYDEEGFRGYGIGRVKLLITIALPKGEQKLAVIEEYKKKSRDVDSQLWRLEAQTRRQGAITLPRTAVIPVESIVRSAHVIPAWKELGAGISCWQVFDKPGHNAYLNHFIDLGTFDMVEGTGQ